MPGFIHGHRCRPKVSTNGFTPAYNSWRAMKARCDNPRNERYAAYGGRGISYDPRWKTFEAFLHDMGDPPPGCVLSRENHDKDYNYENCSWAPQSANSGKRRV